MQIAAFFEPVDTAPRRAHLRAAGTHDAPGKYSEGAYGMNTLIQLGRVTRETKGVDVFIEEDPVGIQDGLRCNAPGTKEHGRQCYFVAEETCAGPCNLS